MSTEQPSNKSNDNNGSKAKRARSSTNEAAAAAAQPEKAKKPSGTSPLAAATAFVTSYVKTLHEELQQPISTYLEDVHKKFATFHNKNAKLVKMRTDPSYIPNSARIDLTLNVIEEVRRSPGFMALCTSLQGIKERSQNEMRGILLQSHEMETTAHRMRFIKSICKSLPRVADGFLALLDTKNYRNHQAVIDLLASNTDDVLAPLKVTPVDFLKYYMEENKLATVPSSTVNNAIAAAIQTVNGPAQAAHQAQQQAAQQAQQEAERLRGGTTQAGTNTAQGSNNTTAAGASTASPSVVGTPAPAPAPATANVSQQPESGRSVHFPLGLSQEAFDFQPNPYINPPPGAQPGTFIVATTPAPAPGTGQRPNDTTAAIASINDIARDRTSTSAASAEPLLTQPSDNEEEEEVNNNNNDDNVADDEDMEDVDEQTAADNNNQNTNGNTNNTDGGSIINGKATVITSLLTFVKEGIHAPLEHYVKTYDDNQTKLRIKKAVTTPKMNDDANEIARIVNTSEAKSPATLRGLIKDEVAKATAARDKRIQSLEAKLANVDKKKKNEKQKNSQGGKPVAASNNNKKQARTANQGQGRGGRNNGGGRGSRNNSRGSSRSKSKARTTNTNAGRGSSSGRSNRV